MRIALIGNQAFSLLNFRGALIEDLVAAMQANPKGVRFPEACKVCEHFFGPPRQSGSSHRL